MHWPSELSSVYTSFISSLLFFPLFSSSLFILHFPWCQPFSLLLLPWFLSISILLSSCVSCPSPHLPLSLLSLQLSPFVPSQLFAPHLPPFISPSPQWTPDLKIVLAIPPPQEDGGMNSLRPERVSTLPVCDLKPCLMLKPIHPLSTTFYSLWRTVTMDIQLNIHLTEPSRSVLCFCRHVCLELLLEEAKKVTILYFWKVCRCPCVCIYSNGSMSAHGVCERCTCPAMTGCVCVCVCVFM